MTGEVPKYHSSVRKTRIPPAPGPDEAAEPPSKSQRKRDSHALQAIGDQLVALPDALFDRVPLDESLHDALVLARRITNHEGRRRQMQYVGKLMRNVDPGPITAAIEQLTDGSRRATALQHAAERWRDRLIAEPGALSGFPPPMDDAERARFNGAVEAARAEVAAGPNGRRYRELFRLVRDALAASEQAQAARPAPTDDDDD